MQIIIITLNQLKILRSKILNRYIIEKKKHINKIIPTLHLFIIKKLIINIYIVNVI